MFSVIRKHDKIEQIYQLKGAKNALQKSLSALEIKAKAYFLIKIRDFQV